MDVSRQSMGVRLRRKAHVLPRGMKTSRILPADGLAGTIESRRGRQKGDGTQELGAAFHVSRQEGAAEAGGRHLAVRMHNAAMSMTISTCQTR